MRKKHKKRKKSKKQNQNRRATAAPLALNDALEKIARLKREKDVHPSSSLVDSVDYHIAELTANHFVQYSKALMIYIDVLTINQTSRYKDKIARLDDTLRLIPDLQFSQNILSYKQLWETQAIRCLRSASVLRLDVIPGTFLHYYMSHQLDLLIESGSIPISDIIRSFFPDHIFLFSQSRLVQVSDCAMVIGENDSMLKMLLDYCSRLKNFALFKIVMDSACKTGRFDIVSIILLESVKLDTKTSEDLMSKRHDVGNFLLVINNAIAAKSLPFLDVMIKTYGAQEIIAQALKHHFYFIASMMIFMGEKRENLVNKLLSEQLHRVVELAAVQHDILILKKIFYSVPNSEREQLFTKHVAPYLLSRPPLNRMLQSSGEDEYFRRSADIVRYYMERGLFTFSLEEEAQNPSLFGPRACGNLGQWAAFSNNIPGKNAYGIIRKSLTTTKFEEREFSVCAGRISQSIEHRGESKHPLLDLLDSDGKVCAVEYQASRRFELTKYIRLWKNSSSGPSILSMVHTMPCEFNDLSAEIQKLYARLPMEFSLFNNPFSSLEICVDVLKNIARIIGLKAQENLYNRGTSYISAIIHYALLNLYGLTQINLNERTEINFLTVDIHAISFDSLEAWVQFYPDIFGAEGSYENCIKKLGATAQGSEDSDTSGTQDAEWVIDRFEKILLSETTSFEKLDVTLFSQKPTTNNNDVSNCFPSFRRGFLNSAN